MDRALPWPEHYVRYGFAVVAGLVDPEWCAAAVADVRRYVADDRPLAEWTSDRPGQRYTVFYRGERPVFDRIYEQPRLLAALDTLFGEYGFTFGSTDPEDPNRVHYALWLSPWDPAGRRRFNPLGHIDSGSPWRGMAFYVSLVDTEPFGGNTTLFPATHLAAHARMLAERPGTFAGGVAHDIHQPHPPYEFVARAGDVAFVHHLTYHTGNPNAAEHHSPRLAARFEVFPERPLCRLDPGRRDACPWERGFPSAEPVDLPGVDLPRVDLPSPPRP